MKILFRISAIVLLFGLLACEDDYYSRTSQNGAGELIPIIEVLQNQPDFSQFVDMLRKTGVDQLLVKGTVYTVFAPTNTAIDAYNANRAAREALLGIPGIGPKGAAAILNARRRGTLRDVKDLQAIGVRTKQLPPFVVLDGQRTTYQLPLQLKIDN